MTTHIEVIGYQPKENVPPEDYPDFPIGRSYTEIEMREMLSMGHVPPGLIVACKGRVGVVKGHYFETQRIEMVRRIV